MKKKDDYTLGKVGEINNKFSKGYRLNVVIMHDKISFGDTVKVYK